MARASNQRQQLGDFWQGVSSQPPWKRFSSQLEDSQNMQHDPLDGARTRSATELLGSTETFTTGDEATIRVIPFRDKFIHVSAGSVKAYDSDYSPITIVDNAGDNYAYLSGIDPQTKLDWTMAVDTLILANTTITVLTENTPAYTPRTEVQFYSDLEGEVALAGDIIRVLLSENLDPAGYYKKLSGGLWERTANPDEENGRFTLTTVPHRLIYNETINQFTWDQLPLNDRLSGGPLSNLPPRFIDNKILGVRFHSGRLCFVSKEAVEMSRANDIFTWFVNDIKTTNDADRISVDILDGSVGDPMFVESLGPDLLIFCEGGVLSFSAGDQQLTSSNGRLRKLSDLRTQNVKPASNGQAVVVADQFNDIHLFSWQGLVQGIGYVGKINDHVRKFFNEKTVRDLYVVEQTTYLVMSDWTVFVNDLIFGADGPVQNAWSRYEFYDSGDTGGRTVAIAPWADKTRIVQSGSDWRILNYNHRYPTIPTGFDYSPRLDQRELVSPVEYDEQTDRTRFVHSADDASLTYSEVHTPDGEVYKPQAVSQRSLWIKGKFVEDCFIGFSYSSFIDLTAFYAGPSDLRVKLRKLNIFHVDTGSYTLKAGRTSDSLKDLPWAGRAAPINNVGSTTIQTGHSRHSVIGDGRSTYLRIQEDSGLPMTLSAIEYAFNIRGG